MFTRALPLFVAALAILPNTAAQELQTRRGWIAIDEDQRVIKHGNVSPLLHRAVDLGEIDPEQPMQHLTLVLAIDAEKQKLLDKFLDDVQNPNSDEFRRFLTPEVFAERFGRTEYEISVLSQWLRGHGFSVDEIAKGRNWINFSGAAWQVERALRTPIHNFAHRGELKFANTREPSVPTAISHLVAAITGLDNLEQPRPMGISQPQFTSTTGAHFLAPLDFATIYNLGPLYAAGLNGNGREITIVGRTDIDTSDNTNFGLFFGQGGALPGVIHNGPAPGIVSVEEATEALLDTEWSSAVAPIAAIQYVVTAPANGDVGGSIQFAINNNFAPLISVSFGQCERLLGTAYMQQADALAQQAAAQGQTIIVSSGDTGAAGCDSQASTAASGGLGVNGLCASPFITCVGGTQFNEAGQDSLYWRPNSGPPNHNSAISYIPEIAWNESAAAGGSQLFASGGGQSAFFAKPAFQQKVPGIANDGTRDVPDVSLTAAGHDGYLIYQGGLKFIGGTSASAPSFAGIVAILMQKLGVIRLGNINPALYALGRSQYTYNCLSSPVFHDVTTGNNSVPGQIGFIATPGYDVVTGLGSIDATAFVNNFSNPCQPVQTITPSQVSFGTVAVGGVGTTVVQLRNTGNATLTFGGLLLTASPYFSGTTTCGASLPQGSSCIATLKFTPSVFGLQTAQLVVLDNTLTGQYTIPLQGDGERCGKLSTGVFIDCFRPTATDISGEEASNHATEIPHMAPAVHQRRGK